MKSNWVSLKKIHLDNTTDLNMYLTGSGTYFRVRLTLKYVE